MAPKAAAARLNDSLHSSRGSAEPHPSVFLSRWVFLRLLGIVYLTAFVSLWVQVEGLIGTQGVLPVVSLLDAAERQLGDDRFWVLPTLCWLSPTDPFLHLLCAAGVLLSLLVVLGVAAPYCLLGLWGSYLSLVNAGQDFLAFQWDSLLLEAGLLAVFFAPHRFKPGLRREPAPSRILLFLLRWLLFRLMFLSGVVKLASGDPTWRDLSALQYHYETQPLPTAVGWLAHQLPGWVQRGSTLGMFLVELGLPFLIFGPRRLRRIAFAGLVGLQTLIALTGNYAFFNLLTVALSVLLLDDSDWPARWRSKIPQPAKRRWWPLSFSLPFAALVLLLSGMTLAGHRAPWPAPLRTLYQWVAPFDSINGYGLFSIMTTSRPEIVIEGSRDGEAWQAYEFHWKPGDLSRRPGWVAPHQPRLDWQMWFAALGSYRDNPWFLSLLGRLLEGSPPVLALLAHDPFPGEPPRYIRAVLYDYYFTDLATLREKGTWWRREPKGLYAPVLSHE
jgi:hypothetical protein